MTPADALYLYMLIKLHFSTTSFDGDKYGWRLKTAPDFSKRKDKYFFNKLSRQSDPRGLLVANLSHKPKMWVGDLFLYDAQKRFNDWRRYRESLTYCFTEDLNKLTATSFKVIDGQHPHAFQQYLGEAISLETLAICNDFINFTDVWDAELTGDPIWSQYSLFIKRYKSFLDYERPVIKKAIAEWCSS